jgi:hypothetical protein
MQFLLTNLGNYATIYSTSPSRRCYWSSWASNDLVSQWFQAYVKRAGIDVVKILEARKLSREIMEEITAAAPPAL